jgi:APA family basic amino acid/polyamine antiporter
VSIPVAMVAYTGIETVSNMAEEAIDPPRHVPRSIMYVVLAVFAIYAFLPSVALSALPVQPATAQQVKDSHDPVLACPKAVKLGEPTSDLACRYAGDPVAGLVEHLTIPNTIKQGMAYYVAILAATILIIATNAGIIGVSRLTYSMGQHRQLPEAIRHVHPRFNTPYIAIILYSAIAVLLMIPPGAIAFLGNLYAFGAMLSFTLAHASVIKMRRTLPSADMPWRGPLSFQVGSYDLPLFAVLGFIGCGASWLVTVALHFKDGVAPVGIIWLAIGMCVYVVYRRTQHLPLTETVLAPRAVVGPAVEVEYRSILLPLTAHRVTDEMTATALQLAAESRTKLVALYPISVPMNLPLSAPMEAESRQAEHELSEAAALGREYGVYVIPRIVRTRNVGQAIVDEARQRRSEIIVLGAEQRKRGGERMFGRVIDYVLRNADCRVMVGTQPTG